MKYLAVYLHMLPVFTVQTCHRNSFGTSVSPKQVIGNPVDSYAIHGGEAFRNYSFHICAIDIPAHNDVLVHVGEEDQLKRKTCIIMKHNDITMETILKV